MSPRNFFTARVYAKLLHNDPYGRISNMQFFNYVMRKGEELVLHAQLNYLHTLDSLCRLKNCDLILPFQCGCIRPVLV